MSLLKTVVQTIAREKLDQAKKLGEAAKQKVGTFVGENTEKLQREIQKTARNAETAAINVHREVKKVASDVGCAAADLRQRTDAKLRKGVDIQTPMGSLFLKKTRVRKTGATRFDVKVEAAKRYEPPSAKTPVKKDIS